MKNIRAYLAQFLIIATVVLGIWVSQTGAWTGIIASVGDTITVAKWNEMVASFNSWIQFQDEGTNLWSTGTVNTLKFVGSGILATRSGNTVTVTSSGTFPGSPLRSIQFNSGTTEFGGATQSLVNSSGNIVLLDQSGAVAYSSGSLVLYNRRSTGMNSLVYMNGYSQRNEIRTAAPAKRSMEWLATWNSATPHVNGAPAWNTQVGTAPIAVTPVLNTTQYAAYKRMILQSAAGARSTLRYPNLEFYAGNGTTKGGYFYLARFGISHAAANRTTARAFIGMANVSLPNAEITTFTNIIWVGFTAGGTVWSFVHSDAAAGITQSATTLTTQTTSTDMYELRVYVPPGTTRVFMSLENLVTGAIAEYDSAASADVPAAGVGLYPIVLIGSSATNTAQLDIAYQYMETYY